MDPKPDHKPVAIPSSERTGATHMVYKVRCCRTWEVVVSGLPMGTCGLCGQVPK